ncbi:SDR family NAD(P)-dependent oxidoreductase [Nocardioides sp. W7]|uniref:SDR family NAD(P)-dependent oxidoreductase n=1 Tax=Nocardioides sp. W7 TaxID=2931390 RepID=UPI001FD31C7B|nr:SDR family NAD(P)-dependent oxidoreductase [Nocardioides sp. W7]
MHPDVSLPDAERLTRGTALVTGGGSGIGEGLVRRLTRRGMTVLVADIDLDRAETVAVGVRADGGDARAHAVDVTDPAAVDRLAQEVFERHGSLELLVNNAGIETGGRVWEVDPARWRSLVAVNLGGVFHGIAAFVPRMIAQGSPGTVANVASVGGVTSMPFQGAYIASKHAVVGLSECLFHDLAETGSSLQVSVVLPGWVRTRIFADAGSHAPQGASGAGEHFEALTVSNQERGLDPLDAADRIVEGLAGGDFWVFTDDRGPRLMRQRGEQLLAGGLPVQP